MARRVTARIAGLRPGTSPPPVRIPITPRFALMLAITLGLPFRRVLNIKLSPEERILGRVETGFVFQEGRMQIFDLEITVRFSYRGRREISQAKRDARATLAQ